MSTETIHNRFEARRLTCHCQWSSRRFTPPDGRAGKLANGNHTGLLGAIHYHLVLRAVVGLPGDRDVFEEPMEWPSRSAHCAKSLADRRANRPLSAS